MQWSDGCGSFTGYAGKLSADVDAGPSVPNLWQHRGPTDPLSPRDSAGSASQTARDTVYKKDHSTGCGRVIVRRCCRTYGLQTMACAALLLGPMPSQPGPGAPPTLGILDDYVCAPGINFAFTTLLSSNSFAPRKCRTRTGRLLPCDPVTPYAPQAGPHLERHQIPFPNRSAIS